MPLFHSPPLFQTDQAPTKPLQHVLFLPVMTTKEASQYPNKPATTTNDLDLKNRSNTIISAGCLAPPRAGSPFRTLTLPIDYSDYPNVEPKAFAGLRLMLNQYVLIVTKKQTDKIQLNQILNSSVKQLIVDMLLFFTKRERFSVIRWEGFSLEDYCKFFNVKTVPNSDASESPEIIRTCDAQKPTTHKNL